MQLTLNPQIFREYDIRGIVDSDLSEDFAYILGKAYAELIPRDTSSSIAVSHDCRESSPRYAEALASGIAESGLDVMFLGMGPTPRLYHAVFTHALSGGIQVTGSHNPSNMNGFKICIGKETLSGAQIQKLKSGMQRIVEVSSTPAAGPAGRIVRVDTTEEYITDLVERIKPALGKRKLTVVLDAGNGAGGPSGVSLFRRLGFEVIELFCEPDGQFPNHHPDPTELKNLVQLQATVRESGADIGIGFDGDADRVGIVDENGAVIFGDMIVLILARAILKAVPGAKIIGDVKCSQRLFSDIESRGGEAIMWKTGHSLMKKKLFEESAALAGEMSGHIFFQHRFYGFDDALYTAARFLEILSQTSSPTSSLLDGVPPMVATPEIRIDCPEEQKFEIPKLVSAFFRDLPTNEIDGVRIEFPRGWGLVRASNTQPVLVLRFEAETEALLQEYQSRVEQALKQVSER